MELNNIELLSLAGLLHDIGKILQRASLPLKEDSYNKNEYCPVINNHFSYIHSAHTADFLDWFSEEFNIKSKNSESNLVNIASYHHKDIDNPLCKVVRVGDHLSSGFERKPQEESEDYVKAQLTSIFSSVFQSKEYYFPLKKLDFDIVPIEKSENTKQQYEAIYTEFKKELEQLKGINNFNIFFDSLNYLLEKYTWAVPASAYKTKPDISLYDHSRITAAMAVALYKYFEQTNKVCQENDSENCFALIQGDFSGIQNFIFSKQGESNKFAAKILRARSFFVSLATELVAYKVCKNLGLTKASILINAGGKFTILSHNASNIEEVIDNVMKEVNSEFYRLSFGQTRFVIAFEKLSPKDFMLNNTQTLNKNEQIGFSKKFGALIEKLAINKLRPELDSYVFEDYLTQVSEKGICDICNQHPAYKEEDGVAICEFCSNMKKIGEGLVKNNYYYISSSGEIKIFSDYALSFTKNAKKDLKDLSEVLLVFDIGSKQFEGFAKSKISTYVPKFKENPLENPSYKDIKNELDGLKEGDIKPFSAIAADCVGKEFLGVLKADVDNLGYIFAKGFEEDSGISKTVALSRMLDFFFTGWLQNRIEEHYRSIYTVFSGGDDLFLIGPFDQIVDIARDINKHFKEYTKNDYFHLSCGIYFAKEKISVYQMAHQAEELLKESKNVKNTDNKASQLEKILKDKKSITLFGKTVDWDIFDRLLDINLKELFDKEADLVSSGFIYKLFTYLDMIENINQTKKSISTRDLMWKPLFVYNVYRNIGKALKNEIKAEYVKTFLDTMLRYFQEYKGNFVIALNNYIYRERRRNA